MFSFGIVRPEDYRPESSRPQDRLRRILTGNRLSLQLLRAGRVDAFEAIMRGLRLNAGIYRTTFQGRFRNVDPVINRLLASRYPNDAPLAIHDWAASDCLTSVEWAASLFESFPRATLTASDLTMFFLEIALPDGTAYVGERDGALLQYIAPPFVADLNTPQAPRDAVSRMLVNRARRKFADLAPMRQIPEVWLDSAETDVILPTFVARKLLVVHPAAAALAARDPRFRVMRHSVFESLAEPADVIRTMNIYNLSYFKEPQLLEGGRAVRRSLKPGGVWIVGRTWQEDPPATNFSAFEKTERGLRLLERGGEGSEVEALMLAASFPEQ
jgi:hypothetical protein